MVRLNRRALAASLLLSAPAAEAVAQGWPSGPVKMIVGFAAGGSTDVITRDIASELEKSWKQPVVVDNRAGANGALAAGQLARPAANGQTLMRGRRLHEGGIRKVGQGHQGSEHQGGVRFFAASAERGKFCRPDAQEKSGNASLYGSNKEAMVATAFSASARSGWAVSSSKP
jgi:Tripartite tricarboxylate transporter family receptor